MQSSFVVELDVADDSALEHALAAEPVSIIHLGLRRLVPRLQEGIDSHLFRPVEALGNAGVLEKTLESAAEIF